MTPYDKLKLLKKETGVGKITDLLVLAPQNDPFYMGQLGQVEKSKWFTTVWNSFGFTSNVHIRRIHYRMVSQTTPIIKPDGIAYKNIASDYKYLNEASKSARYIEDSISPSDFVDRRNADPIINDVDEMELPEVSVSQSFYMMSDIVMPSLPYLIADGDPFQDIPDQYMVEVWSEKSTMNDIILPIVTEMNVNYVYGMGELSLTLVDELINRIIERGKPTRIFYISDFDPAGLIMPVSISRKIEFLARELDIRLFPLMLTQEQCTQYDLPRTPIKDTDRRKNGFEDSYGVGATELDALEALYPGVFGQILIDAISRYRQPDFEKDTKETILEYEDMVADLSKDVHEKYADKIAEAESEWHSIQEASKAWSEKFSPVYNDIINDLEEIEVEEIELPRPSTIPDHEEPLFSTDRSYLEQLIHYKEFQHREIPEEVVDACIYDTQNKETA